MKEHECTFPEYEDRKIGPCLECGYKPGDALTQLREERLDISKKDEMAQLIYDLIYLKQKCPSGKEFSAFSECRGIAAAIIQRFSYPKETK